MNRHLLHRSSPTGEGAAVDGARRISRRSVIGAAAGIGLSAALAGTVFDWASEGPPEAAGAIYASRGRPRPAAPVGQRVLVLLEMAGGNDGLSMVVPTADPAYRRLRPSTALDEAVVIPVAPGAGLHPALRRLAERGAAIMPGVGVRRPDLSHFEMRHRWATGDPDGDASPDLGVLGRACDVVGDPGAPAVGISLGFSPAPILDAGRVTTISLDPGQPSGLALPGDGGTLDAVWAAAWRAMAHPDRAGEALGAARAGADRAVGLAELVDGLPPGGAGYPPGDTAAQLSLAARLVAADRGVRVVHVPLTGDFDVHTNAPSRLHTLYADLDAAVDAFLLDLERRGLADRVLVATASEFGRRPADNGSGGLDHGTAAAMLLVGPVAPGIHGEVPALDRLDADGNPAATTSLGDYLATLTEGWLGAPAGEVLPAGGRPLEGVVVTT